MNMVKKGLCTTPNIACGDEPRVWCKNCPKRLQAKQGEAEKAEADVSLYGVGFIVDGRRVAPHRVQVIGTHLSTAQAADESATEVMMGMAADDAARIELLSDHLRSVIEVARTWRPDYATKMDRDTCDIAEAALPPLGSNTAPSTSGWIETAGSQPAKLDWSDTQLATTDPCPGCEPGGVCSKLDCGRKRSSELMGLYGMPTPKQVMREPDLHAIHIAAANVVQAFEDLGRTKHAVTLLQARGRCEAAMLKLNDALKACA